MRVCALARVCVSAGLQPGQGVGGRAGVQLLAPPPQRLLEVLVAGAVVGGPRSLEHQELPLENLHLGGERRGHYES